MSERVVCPVCGVGSLGPHCPEHTERCSWDQCSVCRAMVDRVKTDYGRPRHTHPSVLVGRRCRLHAS